MSDISSFSADGRSPRRKAVVASLTVDRDAWIEHGIPDVKASVRFVRAAAVLLANCDIEAIIKENNIDRLKQVYDLAILLAEDILHD